MYEQKVIEAAKTELDTPSSVPWKENVSYPSGLVAINIILDPNDVSTVLLKCMQT